MGLLSAVAAAALAQVGPSTTLEPGQVYLCEASHSASTGTHRAGMFLGEAGQSLQAWVRWEQEEKDGGGFNVRWTLDPRLQPVSATVEIDVPLRKWTMGRTSLGLRRPDDDGPADMALLGEVLHGTAGGGRGIAQVGLRTLLYYAADADRLRWYATSTGSRKTRILGFGDIEMAPLREAIAALPTVQAELAARQARYRSECKVHVEEPQI